MIYKKQDWNPYDNSKTEDENLKNHAIVTAEFLNHMEEGIANANNKSVSENGITSVELVIIGSDQKASCSYEDGKLILNIPKAMDGQDGEAGPAGQPGEKGDPGQDGINGKSAYELAVENGFTDTKEKWLLSLKGEKGNPGQDGQNGEKGESGQDGKSAYELAIESGFEGDLSSWLASLKGEKGESGDNGQDGIAGPPGDNGKDGSNGKSAYEVAVENGYTGTVSEWLASLKGAKGDPGKDGAIGPKGDPGQDGIQGPKGLTGGVGSWFEIINSQCTELSAKSSAAARNGIFRGKDLTSLGITEILRRIRNGFEDLFIGDYFDITISTSYTSSEIVRNVIACFNPYWGRGDTTSPGKVLKNHVALVPKNCFTATAQMNSTDTTAGGYKGCTMRTTVLPKYATALNAKLSNSLITYRHFESRNTNTNVASAAGAGWTGSSTEWECISTNISLLSEAQVYGTNNFSSSGFDTGIENFQLPVFALDPAFQVCAKGGTVDFTTNVDDQWYWLKNVTTGSGFAFAAMGLASVNSASQFRGVRPLYLIG